jgi:pyruvate dehydrogenase E2 component (dihydrolipoamide acetyltransferase)
MIEFTLPSLGADMERGKLLEWRVKPGDAVSRGQVVAVVDTEKAAVDVENWKEGVVHQLIVQPGETVPVGAVLAILREPGESARQVDERIRQRPVTKPATEAPAAKAAGVTAEAAPAPEARGRKPVSPAARRRAEELHVDVSAVTGTGPHGSVTLADVERSAQAAPPDAAAHRKAGMRRAIAAAMSRSKREIPHYYLSEEIPMQRALDWLAGVNAARPVTDRLLPGVLLLKSAALALRRAPELNGFWRNDQFEPGGGIHVGVAISLRQGGLVAPAIHDADRKPLDELMRGLTDLVQRARAGSLRSSELSDPTITVTSLGDQGAGAVFGVIYPPQVALVGFGRISERPWVDGGTVRALAVVTASLSGDHRVSDGIRGARFLVELNDMLQHPEAL